MAKGLFSKPTNIYFVEFRSLAATEVKLRPGGMQEVLDAVSKAVVEAAATTAHHEL